MNHVRLIRTTINKYKDFPTVQEDMRKILKYASSQNRMFVQRIIDNEPSKAVDPRLAELIASTEVFEASPAFTNEVRADAVTVAKAVTAQVVLGQAGAYAAVEQDVTAKYDDQPAVVAYLKSVAGVILAEIEAVPSQQLVALRMA